MRAQTYMPPSGERAVRVPVPGARGRLAVLVTLEPGPRCDWIVWHSDDPYLVLARGQNVLRLIRTAKKHAHIRAERESSC